MLNTKYYTAFASNESFGSVFVKRLYDYFGDIESAWYAEISDLYKIEGLTENKIKTFLKLRSIINPDEEFEKLEKSEISFITYDDLDYPKLLRQIPDPPMWLYYRGNRNLFSSEYNIAVVGSRKCSVSGKAVLTKILSEFKNTDLCVVSGLALGIDAAAHKAALDNNIKTIAVLGSGLKNIYPNANKKLFQDIIENDGLVLSEYPIHSGPQAFHFPLRNRIVSGMSPCTLVAEAALKSGALITARLCLEQNRELLCIPGAISNPATEGIYQLLKQGAGIVTCGDDILSAMNWQLTNKVSFDKIGSTDLTEDERITLNALRQDSLTIDEIAIKTGLQAEDLMVILTRLELEDYVVQSEGDRYSAI
ncbi:MAG: DNA-processing protein DprA [Candidatus Gastranaerophilaceae bacterium]